MNKKLILFFAFGCASFFGSLEAAYTVRNGKLVDAESVPTMSLEEHYNAGCEAMNKRNWREGVKNFQIVSRNAPLAPIGQESLYWLGVCYFNYEEYDFANFALSDYLKGASNPAYFQDAVEYKYMIAEKFRNGAKRHPYGTKHLPKWASGLEMAAEIYEEVIAAMPSSEIAARAYYAKGWLLWEQQDYRGSIESFQNLISRFPKDDLAPESYLMITYIYLDQAKREFQNPDLIAFAEMAYKKFKQDFPKEERLLQAEQYVQSIKELYAKGLFDTGRFYERTDRADASLIYYQSAITQFPETRVAAQCRGRLQAISPQSLVNQVDIESTTAISEE